MPIEPHFVPTGRHRLFVLTILESEKQSYPKTTFSFRNAVYHSSPSLVYTVVPYERPNKYEYSEVAWTTLGELRLWGAIALSIREGDGFYSFYPLTSILVCLHEVDTSTLHRIAVRQASKLPPQAHELHWILPATSEIQKLYDALIGADNVLLRGVSCYLKSHMLWRHHFFMEEMGINLHIALEAGLSTLRRRLSNQSGKTMSFRDVYEFIANTFTHGEALAEFWEDRRRERNMLLHPDSSLGAYALHPIEADDVYELLDPMLSLYRYLLLNEPRPTFDLAPGGFSDTPDL